MKEAVMIVDLDPNWDRDFSSSAIAKTLEIGVSRVEGHYGNHSIRFDDDARYGLLTNPGNGEIWILSLADFNIIGKHKAGGMPTKVIVIGGEESKHRFESL